MLGDRSKAVGWIHEPALDDPGGHLRPHPPLPASSPKFDAMQEKFRACLTAVRRGCTASELALGRPALTVHAMKKHSTATKTGTTTATAAADAWFATIMVACPC